MFLPKKCLSILLLSTVSPTLAEPQMRAPRPPEQAGISIYPFNQDAGFNIDGEVERDVHVPRDLFVGRNLTVAGTITGMIVAIPPLILRPLVGNQACIIFQQADLFEKARICSTTILNDKGVFISVDAGVTENFRVTNDGDTSLANNLLMLDSTTTVGNVYKSGDLFLHNFGSANTFLGEGAGNLTLTGASNSGFGSAALALIAAGNLNTAIGKEALTVNTDGSFNTAVGANALSNNDLGTRNTALGASTLVSNTGGNRNVAVGHEALTLASSPDSNVAVGAEAMGLAIVTGGNNVALGDSALANCTAGSSNVCIGFNAGTAISTGASNIFIGAGQLGGAIESFTTRIGAGGTTTQCFIEGIEGVNVGSVAEVVSISGDQLGSTVLTAGSNITITPGANTITISAAGAAAGITTINGDVGSVTGDPVTITGGTSGAVFTGVGATLTESFNFLALPDSTSSSLGVIRINGSRFAHAFPGTATSNTFVGSDAGNFTTGGIGGNSGFGANALSGLSTGFNNTAVGLNAGASITTGGGNTLLGSAANVSSASAANRIVIGNGTIGLNDNEIRIGFGTAASTRCFVDGIRGIATGIADAIPVLIDSAGQLGTVSSSRRYKTNIYPLEDSSDVFMQLNPVEFTYMSDETDTPQWGLIAEEVEELYPELVVYNNYGNPETIKYHLLYALLIKMIQENRKLGEENRQLINELFALYAAAQKIAA